jgi:hypothetical protein
MTPDEKTTMLLDQANEAIQNNNLEKARMLITASLNIITTEYNKLKTKCNNIQTP